MKERTRYNNTFKFLKSFFFFSKLFVLELCMFFPSKHLESLFTNELVVLQHVNIL